MCLVLPNTLQVGCRSGVSKLQVKVRRVPPRSTSDRVAKHILAAVAGDEDITD